MMFLTFAGQSRIFDLCGPEFHVFDLCWPAKLNKNHETVLLNHIHSSPINALRNSAVNKITEQISDVEKPVFEFASAFTIIAFASTIDDVILA